MTLLGKLWRIVVAGALITHSVSASELPDMGHSASRILSPKDEQQIGLNVYRTIQQSKKWRTDLIVEDYVQRLGQRLLSPDKYNRIPFRFFMLQDNSLNAFALPGGFVGVHTGLITATESESELASVMAHEIAHVKLHHIARMYEHMGRMQLSTIIGIVASIVLATQSAEAASGAMAATLAGRQQALINYTRDHEKEADDEGMRILAHAGFDPQGMPSLFARMYHDTRYYGSNIPEYLLTHPLTQSRLYYSKANAEHYPYRQVPDTLLYHLVRARIQEGSFAFAKDAQSYFKEQLDKKTYRNRWSAQYGLVLSYLRANQPQAALNTLEPCLTTYPQEPLFHLALAEIYVQKKQVKKAITILQNALSFNPYHKALVLRTSELLTNSEPKAAVALLLSKQNHFQYEPYFFEALSKAQAQASHPVQAHLAQASYYEHLYDYGSALTQVKLAKNVIGQSPRERKQVDAKMKSIQRLMQQSPFDK